MAETKDSTELRDPRVVENSELDPTNMGSVALDRLIEEVHNSEATSPTAYNRTYHRHNR